MDYTTSRQSKKSQPCLSTLVQTPFYNNYKNYCALAHWLIFIVNKRALADEFIIYAMRQRVKADNLKICYYRKKQIEVSL